MWEFFSSMSTASNSIASNSFRDYVKRVAESQKIIADVLPRWIQPIPPVDKNGKVNDQFIEHFQDEGRIFQART